MTSRHALISRRISAISKLCHEKINDIKNERSSGIRKVFGRFLCDFQDKPFDRTQQSTRVINELRTLLKELRYVGCCPQEKCKI